jgi:PKD repeat protein
MLFGMDSGSASAETAAGVKPDYGTFWIGPWTLTSGWGGPDGQLDAMRNAGVTPAIHFYYWGDDISQTCLENGCWSSLHNTQKDKAHWQMLADQLVSHLNSKMQGKPVVIFLETEFNKGDVATYEPLDGYLTDKVNQIHQGYPAAKVVMSLGNWDSKDWVTWDRTATAADLVGIQGMRGSTRQSATDYATLFEGVLSGSKTLQSDFHKPIILQDIALSTYPEPDYLDNQASELQQFFAQMGDLRATGVQGLVYRSWLDSPSMSTANYYGEAERHWGVAWAGNGTQKAGGHVWVDGVKAERSRASNQAPSAAFSAAVSGLAVAVDGSASADPDGQALSYAWSFGDGASALGKTASHAYAAAGTYTVALSVSDGSLSSATSKPVAVAAPNRAPTASFTAAASQLNAAVDASASSDPDGDALAYAWTFGDGASASGKTASHAYSTGGTYTVALSVSDGKSTATATRSVTTSGPYTADFATKSASNEYWEQESVAASPDASKVELQVNGGAWQAMKHESYGDWTSGLHIAKGTPVAFRATASDGRTTTTAQQPWLGAATSSSSSSTSTAPKTSSSTTSTAPKTTTTTPTSTTSSTAFKATFSPSNVGNDWWVETRVSGNQYITKVEAKVGSGAWTQLTLQDWGSYAKSMNAPNGSQVSFRATATSGAVAYSQAYTWT